MISLSSQGLSSIMKYPSKEGIAIHVGSSKYVLPKLIAVFISPIIAEKIRENPDLNKFELNINDEQKIFRLVVQLAYGNQVQFEPHQLPVLEAIGKALGNQELVILSQTTNTKTHEDINIQNAVTKLISKKKLRAKYDFIIEYIAFHFSDMSEKDLEKLEIDDIQKIVSHSKFRTNSESSLFRFIFGLYMEHNDDPRYSELFSKVLFEKLDEEEMSDFVNNFSSNQMTDGIWQAISRRLILPVSEPEKDNESATQSKASSRKSSPPNARNSTKQPVKIIEFNGKDFYNGCFYTLQSKKKHVLLSSSSINTGTIRSIINPSNKTNYWTQNQPDSWIKVDLKKNKIHPTSYTIRGRYDHDFNQPQSWNFEGFAKGKWEILDSHINEPLRIKEPKNFKLSVEGKFNSFRIRQTGPNTYGDLDLVLSAFEVFGEIY